MGAISGLMGDIIMEGASQAIQGPWLRSGFQPPDALPLVGNERRMPRYPSDTDATYRERLAEAWSTYGRGGNEGAIIEQLIAFGLTNPVVIPAENSAPTLGFASSRVDTWRFEEPPTIIATADFDLESTGTSISGMTEIVLTGAGVTWTSIGAPSAPTKVWFDTPVNGRHYMRLDSFPSTTRAIVSDQLDPTLDFTDESLTGEILDFTNWSRFVVVIEQPNPYESWSYGDGFVYGEGDEFMTYGSTATQGDIRSIKAIIRKWKERHAINPLFIIELVAGPYYGDPDLEYGDPGLVYDDVGERIFILHQT